VLEQNVPSPPHTTALETIAALLRKEAEQANVKLPKDVALYLAQNVRSNARFLEVALKRTRASSSVNSSEIVRYCAQLVLRDYFDQQARNVAVDPFQKRFAQRFSTKEAQRKSREVTAASNFSFRLLTARDGGKASQIRQTLEVNMRESERESLAGYDAYERDLAFRAKKRKQE
jgi:phosphopantetheinyl transferase (holo-ACP synthase)